MIYSYLALYLAFGASFASPQSVPAGFQDLLGEHCRSWCGSPSDGQLTIAPRVGKAGPRGPQGIQGPRGIVNMTAVEGLIDQKIDSAIGKLLVPSCDEIANNTSTSRSGVFYTNHPTICITELYCDMETDGGGWTVIQRRIDGAVNFYRSWYSYKHGFGEKSNEFWLGLELLHLMTSDADYELRIDMTKLDGSKVFAKYRTFKVGPESDNYRLTVNGYSGNATDRLEYHNNHPFTTKDNKNDQYKSNCASMHFGAWWYKSCYYSNLNGRFNDHLYWQRLVTFVEMKMRERK